MANKKNNKEVIEIEIELSKYLSTTIDYNKFKDFIKAKHNSNEKTRTFYINYLKTVLINKLIRFY